MDQFWDDPAPPNKLASKGAFGYGGVRPRNTDQLSPGIGAPKYRFVPPFGIRGTQEAGSPDVTLAVTGVAAIGSVGTAKSAVDYALIGVQSTGQLGSIQSLTEPLIGTAASGQVGTVVSNLDKAQTGNQATGQVGTATVNISDALGGASATGDPGVHTPSIAYGLTGAEATGQVGSVSTGGDQSIAVSGVEATGQVGAVSSAIDEAETGVQATGVAGNVTANLSGSIGGSSATGGTGTNTPTIAYSLAGTESIGQVGTVTAQTGTTLAISGVAATGGAGSVTAAVQAFLTNVLAAAEIGSVTNADIAPISGMGFEMYDWPVHARKGDRTRRGIVYVEPGPEDEPKPRKRITKADVDLRRLEAAKQEANRIIADAATAHAGAGLKEARRYAEVRTALKPLVPALGDWNWVAIYQTLYAKALADQIRAELELEDRLQAEDDAIMQLLLTPQAFKPLRVVETEQDEDDTLLMLLIEGGWLA
jgi:hypothetical protein